MGLVAGKSQARGFLAGMSLAVAAHLAMASGGHAEDFKFDAKEFAKPAFQIGGYVEGKGEYFKYERGAAFYRLNAIEKDLGDDNNRATGTAEIRTKYEKGPFTAAATVHADVEEDADQGFARELKLYEGGLALRPMTGLSADAGKKVLKWGKGYGWNPIGFVERTKDPTDPDLSREGFWMLTGDYVQSFNGPLRTIGVTPVFLPVTDDTINKDFGKGEHINFGGKVYALFNDTDIDLAFLANGTKSTRIGADFSRNVLSNLEVHGEAAWIQDATRSVLDENRNIVSREGDVVSFLVGLRYLTAADTTYIVEYYRNGNGFSRDESRDFLRLAHDGVQSFESAGSPTLLNKAQKLSKSGYGGPTPGQDYLYLRVSQKEPFGFLYFTPSLIGIVNLGDRSLSLTPELLYTGITNFEARLRGGVNLGGRLTEFGDKQVEGKIELRVRYFF